MATICSIPGCGGQLPIGATKYCGRPCARKGEEAQRKLRRQARGAVLVGKLRACRGCGVEFVATGPAAKWCDECRVIANREKTARFRASHSARAAEQQRLHSAKRRQKPERREWSRDYQRHYTAKRRQNPRHRLDHRMGQLVRNGLAGTKGGRAWEVLVGYSVADLMIHLARQFLPGMSWANIGDWHVDHILPRAMFTYSSEMDSDFKACWALTNLRPLWSEANLEKGAKRIFLL